MLNINFNFNLNKGSDLIEKYLLFRNNVIIVANFCHILGKIHLKYV